MRRVLIALAAVVLLTACTPREVRLWQKWFQQDPDAAMEYALNLPAPVQSGSDTSSTGSSCTGIIGLLEAHNPGWDVNRMAKIAYRESRCQPGVANSCCTGLFQVHAIWIPKAAECGVYSRSDLYDPAKNVCTAALIYRTQGMQAWAL